MSSHQNLSSIDVFILSGGAGTRLRSVVSDRSKVIADIGGRPFLDILLEELFHWGFERVYLGVGHMKEQIIARYRGNPRILFSEEEKPLGTGGAIKHATPLFQSEHVLVMNGDSFCEVNYEQFYNFHLKNQSLVSMVLARPRDRTDAGNVGLDKTSRLKSFREKTPLDDKERFINAGIYLLRREAFEHMPKEETFSIEQDFFPQVLDKPCYGFVVEKEVMDIGTPERYQKIDEYFKKRFTK